MRLLKCKKDQKVPLTKTGYKTLRVNKAYRSVKLLLLCLLSKYSANPYLLDTFQDRLWTDLNQITQEWEAMHNVTTVTTATANTCTLATATTSLATESTIAMVVGISHLKVTITMATSMTWITMTTSRPIRLEG